MNKIVNITSKEDKDLKLQDIANSLQELKEVMAEVIETYEEENADNKKMDTLTEHWMRWKMLMMQLVM